MCLGCFFGYFFLNQYVSYGNKYDHIIKSPQTSIRFISNRKPFDRAKGKVIVFKTEFIFSFTTQPGTDPGSFCWESKKKKKKYEFTGFWGSAPKKRFWQNKYVF